MAEKKMIVQYNAENMCKCAEIRRIIEGVLHRCGGMGRL